MKRVEEGERERGRMKPFIERNPIFSRQPYGPLPILELYYGNYWSINSRKPFDRSSTLLDRYIFMIFSRAAFEFVKHDARKGETTRR